MKISRRKFCQAAFGTAVILILPKVVTAITDDNVWPHLPQAERTFGITTHSYDFDLSGDFHIDIWISKGDWGEGGGSKKNLRL